MCPFQERSHQESIHLADEHAIFSLQIRKILCKINCNEKIAVVYVYPDQVEGQCDHELDDK